MQCNRLRTYRPHRPRSCSATTSWQLFTKVMFCSETCKRLHKKCPCRPVKQPYAQCYGLMICCNPYSCAVSATVTLECLGLEGPSKIIWFQPHAMGRVTNL